MRGACLKTKTSNAENSPANSDINNCSDNSIESLISINELLPFCNTYTATCHFASKFPETTGSDA